MAKSQKTYSIGYVARQTGLGTHLIRAWEKRYAAIKPLRTETGRRIYGDDDIFRLSLLRKAVSTGFSIQQAAALTNQELSSLGAPEIAFPQEIRAVASKAETENDRMAACLEQVRALDAAGLHQQFLKASVELTTIQLLEELIAPLFAEIGRLWREGNLRPVHEHAATAVARSFLSNLSGPYRAEPSAPRFIVTTPLHQYHVLGALMVAAMAATEGWRVTYIGESLPAEEIAAAVRQTGARVLGLSITYPPDDPELQGDLLKLGDLLEDSVTLLVGGQCANRYEKALQ